MTTLTREQIEETRNILLDRMVPEWCVDDEHAAFWRNRVKAAFALALRGLDTVPRPIEEAPKDGSVIYAFHRSAKRFVPCRWEIQLYHNVPRPFWSFIDGFWEFYSRDSQPTHFIPLSALPEPKA